jgi:hypothetical protein
MSLPSPTHTSGAGPEQEFYRTLTAAFSVSAERPAAR